jgi:uncharacterized protein YoxC
MDQHKLNNCDKITVSCVLKDFGCSKPVVRVHKSKHYMTEQHQSAILNFIRRLISTQSNDQYVNGSGMDTDVSTHPTTTLISSDSQNTNSKLQEICETVDIMVGGIQVLTEDAQRLSDESLRLQNGIDVLSRNLATIQISVQEQSGFLDGIKPNQDILNQNTASLKQKVEDMQFVSYDGSLIWKIANVKEKMSKILVTKVCPHNEYS